jgi:hypothetical protein
LIGAASFIILGSAFYNSSYNLFQGFERMEYSSVIMILQAVIKTIVGLRLYEGFFLRLEEVGSCSFYVLVGVSNRRDKSLGKFLIWEYKSQVLVPSY